ncbi:uncharacterized protein BXZ73DRAFT_95919 [Epithele typhae]|uniref:uncharacterized protein n=1 Tax=Epithele typhae TaxID=378194 RepID=UPI002007C604|nr:uncharacterized protein BXZ73DRAFT_95919 [Epithele typhae]KAH9946421.1 hypothetical protein BXZ73DRAFT_95919 [Epithele typhae]
MGASQSSPLDEKVFTPDTPSTYFSDDVVNQLVDQQASPAIPRERQITLDAHIRSRIQSELARLHQEEARRSMAGGEHGSDEAGPAGSVRSSAVLMGDLEELRQKVEKYHGRQDSEELAEVRARGEEVVSCYRANPTTTLECWKSVRAFKTSVAQVEQNYVNSLR